MIGYSTDNQGLVAAARSIHIQGRSLHLNTEHTHLKPAIQRRSIAVENIGRQHIAHLVAYLAPLTFIGSPAYQVKITYRSKSTRQTILAAIVGVGTCPLSQDKVTDVKVLAVCPGRANTNDGLDIVEIIQLVSIYTDGRDTHAVAHHADLLALESTGKAQHAADIVKLYYILKKIFCHELGAQRVTGHDHRRGNLAVLRTDVRSRYFSHI